MGNGLINYLSSPNKVAQQQASAIGGVDSNLIQSYESYVADQEKAARSAIAGMEGNVKTGDYAVDPKATASFSAPKAPTDSAASSNPFIAPPMPKG